MEIGFLIAFSFIIIILLMFLRWTKVHWIIKSLLIISSIFVVFGFYKAIINSFGWPINYVPTCTMLIEGMDIREPNQDSSGVIYIWYIDVDEATKTQTPGIPRSIRVPYDEITHKKLNKAKEEMQNGIPPYMKFGNSSHKSPGNSNASGSAKSGINGYGTDQDGGGFLDFVPPPNTTPQKEN